MALDIVAKIRDLCKDPANHDVLVMDDTTSLKALVLFLENDDEKVVCTAVEALQELSKSKHLQEALALTSGLAKGVKKLMLSEHDETRTRAIATYANIQEYVASQSEGSKENCSKYSISGNSNGKSAKDAAEYTIFVDGLVGEDDRKMVERALLSLKGIISFTVDLMAQKVVTRTHLDADTVIDAIEKYTCLDASLKPKSGEGQHYEHDYLDDDEEKPTETGWSSWWCGSNVSNAVVKANVAEERTSSGGGFWGRVGTSLWG
mmetsp:Transcript_26706/g.74652  ORF Transcript_26706/g.74652 Transcript_26706/m.74652 type:complete len:262 (+) Transcript_26706:112-897(+)